MPEVDVAMRSEHVRIDLYPTLIHVHATFELEAGARGEPDLRVGFPEELPGQSMTPLERLRVSVDGQPVAAEYSGVWQNVWDLNGTGDPSDPGYLHFRAKSIGASAWWQWSMPIPAKSETTVEVDYIQVLTGLESRLEDEAHYRFMYVFQTGSLWRDSIGEGVLELQLHGIEVDQLKFDDELGERETEGSLLRWRFSDEEPERDLVVTLLLPVEWPADEWTDVGGEDAVTEAPAYLAGMDADMRLLDRWVRIHRGDDGPDAWAEFLDQLHAARSEGGPASAFAESIARDLAREMSEPHTLYPEGEHEQLPEEPVWDADPVAWAPDQMHPEAIALRKWVFDDAPWLDEAVPLIRDQQPQCHRPGLSAFGEKRSKGIHGGFGRECRSSLASRIAWGGARHRGAERDEDVYFGLFELRRQRRQRLGVGIGLGGVVILASIGAAFVLVRRRRRQLDPTPTP
jgi:hypothetical protein